MPLLRLLREADADARREGRRLFASRVAPTLEAAMCEPRRTRSTARPRTCARPPGGALPRYLEMAQPGAGDVFRTGEMFAAGLDGLRVARAADAAGADVLALPARDARLALAPPRPAAAAARRASSPNGRRASAAPSLGGAAGGGAAAAAAARGGAAPDARQLLARAVQVVRNRVAWEAARLNCATVALGVLPPLSVTPGMMDAARYALVENLLDAELDRPQDRGRGRVAAAARVRATRLGGCGRVGAAERSARVDVVHQHAAAHVRSRGCALLRSWRRRRRRLFPKGNGGAQAGGEVKCRTSVPGQGTQRAPRRGAARQELP